MRLRAHPLAEEILERSLEPAEFDAKLQASLTDPERREELAELITWFRRRYPTARERLAYVRRKVRALRGG